MQNQPERFEGELYPFERATEAFEFMWENSFETITHKPNGKPYKTPRRKPVRDVAAWITTKGILVQPWEGPLVDKNGYRLTNYRRNYIDNSGGRSFNNYLPFDKQNMTVKFGGEIYSIFAQIHTHPIYGFTENSIDANLEYSLGIPIYHISGGSIYDAEDNFYGKITNPSKTIFKKMKKIILTFTFSLISLLTRAQQIDISGAKGDSIKNIANRFYHEVAGQDKAVPFVYLHKGKKEIEVFFGLFTLKSSIVNTIPSYWFFTNDSVPVLVYNGLEKDIEFSDLHKETILNIVDQYLYEDIVYTIHYFVWYCKFKEDGSFIFKKQVSNKKLKKLPKWIF